MKKHIIREVPPESYDNRYYFDGHVLTEKAASDNLYLPTFSFSFNPKEAPEQGVFFLYDMI